MGPPDNTRLTPPPRGRRSTRPTGDERQLAILATAERLLTSRSMAEISIDDLARGAGISRPTFYFYFASKDAVLLTLLDRVIAEAETATQTLLEHIDEHPTARWRAALTSYYEIFRAHRAVAVTCAQVRAINPEVRALWAGIMRAWVQRTADAIEAERDRGAAPAGAPAHDLAVVLNSMNERVLYATFADDQPAVGEARVVEVLLDVWLNAIYQTTSPLPPNGAADRVPAAGPVRHTRS